MHLVSWVRLCVSLYHWASVVDLSSLASRHLQSEHCKCYRVEFLVGNQLGFLRKKFCKQTNKCNMQGGFKFNNQIQINETVHIMLVVVHTPQYANMHNYTPPNSNDQQQEISLTHQIQRLRIFNPYVEEL